MADAELKVVITLKEGSATIGVQEKDTDPVMEVVPIVNPEDALQEALVAATCLVERARERWAQAPKNPAYQRPGPPPPAPRPAVARTGRSQGPAEGHMDRMV